MEGQSKNKRIIYILEYSRYPGPRYCNQGEHSGEDFYHSLLNERFKECFEEKSTLVINLDGVAGFASSFLDESIGNLVFDFTKANVEKFLNIVSDQEPDWIKMIKDEVLNDWEARRIKNIIPKKTIVHEPWFKLIDDDFSKKVWILSSVTTN